MHAEAKAIEVAAEGKGRKGREGVTVRILNGSGGVADIALLFPSFKKIINVSLICQP